MKKIIIGLMCISSLSASADTLFCAIDNRFSDRPTSLEADVGVEIKTSADCGSHRVTIHGGGAGIYASVADGFVVNCPFQTDVEGKYYGLSVKAAIAFGLGAGAFISSDGACVIGRGAYAALGASVEAATLTIERN